MNTVHVCESNDVAFQRKKGPLHFNVSKYFTKTFQSQHAVTIHRVFYSE